MRDACRVGCDAERPVRLAVVASDLAGLETTGLRGVVILEILIDVHGAVPQACVLRGVRDDVDVRALAAVRQWRFDPARLRHSTPPHQRIATVLTTTVQIGRE